MTFGEEMRDLRIAAGATQSDVARCCRFRPQQIAFMENSPHPVDSIRILAGYAVQCDIPIEVIVGLWMKYQEAETLRNARRYAKAMTKRGPVRRGPKPRSAQPLPEATP